MEGVRVKEEEGGEESERVRVRCGRGREVRGSRRRRWTVGVSQRGQRAVDSREDEN